jgi:hypothetical protein
MAIERGTSFRPLDCHRCERTIPFGEVCFSINVHAEEAQSDGTIIVLGAESAFTVCGDCAGAVQIHTMESPFARLFEHFRDASL